MIKGKQVVPLMPLPDNFSPWEHLQTTLRLTVNPNVRKEFSDIEIDDDITTPRGSLKLACLLEDKDTAIMTLLRMFLYYTVLKGVDIPYYSIPINSINESIRFKPQIHLKFSQNYRDVIDDETPVRSEIKIRLRNETDETLTSANVQTLATKIKSLFGTGTGFTWRRGKGMFTYHDDKKLYNLQLIVDTETEGRRIVEQLLDIQSDTPDWKNSSWKVNAEPTQAYPANPLPKTVLGKVRRQARKRPICTMRFRAALLHMDSLPNPLVLYDKTGQYKTAILKD